jgi:hypothetical protein
MCTSAETTFAWVGTVLINLGFLSLISWGAVTSWPLGFFLSFVYTGFLFSLAAYQDHIREAVVGVFSWLETQARTCFASTEPPRQDHVDVAPLVALDGA